MREETEDETRTWLSGLRGLDLADAEVEAAGERLAGGGPPALPVVLELYLQDDETLLAVATQALKRWPAPRPVEPLLGLLRDPEVDPLSKALILVVLEAYGLDPSSPELVGPAIDLEEYPLDSTPPRSGRQG